MGSRKKHKSKQKGRIIVNENAHNTQEGTLKYLINMVRSWHSKFDHSPDPFLFFTVDDDGWLFLNGNALCPVSEVCVDEEYICDVEFMQIPLKNNTFIQIHVDWPCEGEPFVAYIGKCQCLYCVA